VVAAFTQPTARPLTMAADEEVTKMKEQLKRAMLLCQQSNKQAAAAKAELQTANQTREESDKKAAELVRQNEALQQEVAQLKLAGGEQDGGYDAGLGEELELANARLSESTMQLESVQQELAQQQQQAADKISSLNKKVEAGDQDIKLAVDSALKQERDTFDATQVAYSKAERELTMLRTKVAELEDSTMVKTQEAMSAQEEIEDLKENLKVTKHSSDLAKGELTIKLTDMDKLKNNITELKELKLGLEKSLNETEQKLTFITQERDTMEAEVSQLKEFGSNVNGQVEEFKEREKELNLSHKSELDNLNNELTAARKACSDAVEEMDRVTQESIRKAAIFDDQSAKYTQMEAANKKLEAEVDGFDSKAINQDAQHKLNERKNLKMIKELKAQLVKQMEVSANLEEEAAEAADQSNTAGGANRSRSHTVGGSSNAPTPTSSGAANLDDKSLSDLNFSLGTQLEEVNAELEKKEEMLKHYMQNANTKGLTSAAMDAANQKEDVKCNAGLWGMFVGAKDTVDGEVHRKLKEVLEETLLENIRLKEDVDAMGSEVARLADELETSGGPSEK